jgi:hypothetical protein
LDLAFQQNSKSTLRQQQCRTFIPWDSSPEGVLRHYIYKNWAETKTLEFDETLHYCLIKDDGGKVQAKVYEVCLQMSHYCIHF